MQSTKDVHELVMLSSGSAHFYSSDEENVSSLNRKARRALKSIKRHKDNSGKQTTIYLGGLTKFSRA